MGGIFLKTNRTEDRSAAMRVHQGDEQGVGPGGGENRAASARYDHRQDGGRDEGGQHHGQPGGGG